MFNFCDIMTNVPIYCNWHFSFLFCIFWCLVSVFGVAFWASLRNYAAFPWYIMYSFSFVLAVIASCVSCMHAMSVFSLCILSIISVRFWRVRISPAFVEASTSLLCPSSRLRFVTSLWFRFVLESCLFVLRLRFRMVVFFCAFDFSAFWVFLSWCPGDGFGFPFFVFRRDGSFLALRGLFHFCRVFLVLFCLFVWVYGWLMVLVYLCCYYCFVLLYLRSFLFFVGVFQCFWKYNMVL